VAIPRTDPHIRLRSLSCNGPHAAGSQCNGPHAAGSLVQAPTGAHAPAMHRFWVARRSVLGALFAVAVRRGVESAEAADEGKPPTTLDLERLSGVVPDRLGRRLEVTRDGARPAYWAYVPPASTAPCTVVLAMHGLGQRGDTIGEPLVGAGTANNWFIVAPTIEYGDWVDPNRLATTEPRVMQQALDAVDHARRTLGVTTNPAMLAIGFSRGAQTVARLGVLEPARFLAVATASGGAYTLPTETVPDTSGRLIAAPFPFGVGNALEAIGRFVDREAIANVRFWVGVGANDTSVADLPRQWDRYLGRNRVERATRFANALRRVGAVVQLTVMPGVGHALTPATISSAVNFLRAAELAASDHPPRLLAQAPLPSAEVPAPPPPGGAASDTLPVSDRSAPAADAPWWRSLFQRLWP
jgi:poly(3-hydroxybutyrate) depolymerase